MSLAPGTRLPVSDAGEPLQISPYQYTRANREPLTPPTSRQATSEGVTCQQPSGAETAPT